MTSPLQGEDRRFDSAPAHHSRRKQKMLGQNFLIDANISKKIVNFAEISEGEKILEIGPGRGAYPFGVMLSHYFEVPFEAFRWQTRDGAIEDSETLRHILSKYNSKTVLVVDDINDTGTTLIGINDVIESHAKIDMESAHQDVTYSTLFDKESSKFSNVEYTANRVLPDEERWIVFPYEEWWK